MVIGISCTENERARSFGGKTEIILPKGEIFINATWKDTDLWIITYDSISDTYYMHESSTWGVFEGEVIIRK